MTVTFVVVHRALGRGGIFRPVVVTVDGETEQSATRKQPASFDLLPGRRRFRARFGLRQSNSLTIEVGDQPVSLVVRVADVPDLLTAREPLLLEQSDDLNSSRVNLLHRMPAGRWTLAATVLLLVVGVFDLAVAVVHPNQTARWVIGVVALLCAAVNLFRWVTTRKQPARASEQSGIVTRND